jgi:hypothetical protein
MSEPILNSSYLTLLKISMGALQDNGASPAGLVITPLAPGVQTATPAEPTSAKRTAVQTSNPTQPPAAKRTATPVTDHTVPHAANRAGPIAMRTPSDHLPKANPEELASSSQPKPFSAPPNPNPTSPELPLSVMLEARVSLASFHQLQNMSRTERRSVGDILNELIAQRATGNTSNAKPSYIPARVRPLLPPCYCLALGS